MSEFDRCSSCGAGWLRERRLERCLRADCDGRITPSGHRGSDPGGPRSTEVDSRSTDDLEGPQISDLRQKIDDAARDVAAVTEVRVTAPSGGQKGSKPARFDLIPGDSLWKVAELYGFGARKYAEDRNWERGYDWSLSFAALQRHAWQFWNGEDIDAESGQPHMASVVFHALALLRFMDQHRDYDDRPRHAEG